jgi:hypothetical protein
MGFSAIINPSFLVPAGENFFLKKSFSPFSAVKKQPAFSSLSDARNP